MHPTHFEGFYTQVGGDHFPRVGVSWLRVSIGGDFDPDPFVRVEKVLFWFTFAISIKCGPFWRPSNIAMSAAGEASYLSCPIRDPPSG